MDPSCDVNPIDWRYDIDESGKFIIKWFEGEQVPGKFEDIVEDIDIDSYDTMNENKSEEQDTAEDDEYLL